MSSLILAAAPVRRRHRGKLVLTAAVVLGGLWLIGSADWPPLPLLPGSGNPPSSAEAPSPRPVQGSLRVPVRNGQIVVPVRLNGRKTSGVADSGASAVAIGRAQAGRLGIDASKLRFEGKVSTAGGDVRSAETEVKIGIGNPEFIITCRAVVIESDLEQPLLGLTFLNQLQTFEVRNGHATLAW